MRTTVDLDPELHTEALERARRTRTSLSSVLNDALRLALHPVAPVVRDPETGLGVIRTGRPITDDDVARLADDGV